MLPLCYMQAKLLVTRLLYFSRPQSDFRDGSTAPTNIKWSRRPQILAIFFKPLTGMLSPQPKTSLNTKPQPIRDE